MSENNKPLPNNQEQLYKQKTSQLAEQNKIYEEVRLAVESQRRHYLEREIRLREMVAEIIATNVEERIQSEETKKAIELQAIQQLALKKKEHEEVSNDEGKKNMSCAIAKSEKKHFYKTYIPLIREEVNKAVKRQGNVTVTTRDRQPKQPGRTRGGIYKKERDEYYRYSGRGPRGQRGYRRAHPGTRYRSFDYPPLGRDYY